MIASLPADENLPVEQATSTATKNNQQIANWTLFYSTKRNEVCVEIVEKEDSPQHIRLSNSTSWVRLLRKLRRFESSDIYVIKIKSNPAANYSTKKVDAFVFMRGENGRFAKHTKFNRSGSEFTLTLEVMKENDDLWIGLETSEANIEFCPAELAIEISEVQKTASSKPKTDNDVGQPVVDSTENSSTLRALGEKCLELGVQNCRDEITFALEYADLVRKAKMTDTFINITKYLTVKYHELDPKQQLRLNAYIRHALISSHDQELLSTIQKRCPDVLFKMDLSETLFEALANLPEESLCYGGNTLDKHNTYKHQNDPGKIFSLVKYEISKNKNFLDENPSVLCLLANAYCNRKGLENNYMAYVNKFLEHHDTPHIRNINLSSSNALENLDFEPGAEIVNGPKVSIIVSAFNSAQTVSYAIRSLLEQTYKNIEILICEDQGSDDTIPILKEIAKHDDRIQIFRSNGNQGTYNIRNAMLEEATGDYITFHDSDDFALPTRIEEQVQSLQTSDRLVSYTHYTRVRANGSFVFFYNGALSRFCAVSSMAHRSLFRRLPRFRSSLVGADTEFFEHLKTSIGEDRIAILTKPLLFCLWSDASLTRRSDLLAESNGYLSEKRRSYADICARQRFLGREIIRDVDVESVLRNSGIYREPTGSSPVEL